MFVKVHKYSWFFLFANTGKTSAFRHKLLDTVTQKLALRHNWYCEHRKLARNRVRVELGPYLKLGGESRYRITPLFEIDAGFKVRIEGTALRFGWRLGVDEDYVYGSILVLVVQNLEYQVGSPTSGVRNQECEIRSPKSGLRNQESEVGSTKWGVRSREHHIGSTKPGLRNWAIQRWVQTNDHFIGSKSIWAFLWLHFQVHTSHSSRILNFDHHRKCSAIGWKNHPNNNIYGVILGIQE